MQQQKTEEKKAHKKRKIDENANKTCHTYAAHGQFDCIKSVEKKTIDEKTNYHLLVTKYVLKICNA